MAPNSNASYTYDANGNTTSKTDSAGTTNYTWDYENRLTQVTLPGTGGTATFKYDPFGRRIEKAFTQNGSTTTTNYLYDGDNVIETVDQNGAEVAKYAQGENIDEPLAESTAGTTSYYEQDGLGSVTSLTNSSGAVAQTYTYDSFGSLTNSSGTLTNPFDYTAREFDSETGLYYYRARYYDPTTGRFLSEDPIRFIGGTNSYRYVSNRPVDFRDPLGLCQNGSTSEVGHCVWEAAKQKGISIGLDIAGAIPAFGNVTSAASGIARAGIELNHAVTSPAFSLASGAYGGYEAISAGSENPADSLAGAGSTGAAIGLELAKVSVEEDSKVIPIVGNIVSGLTAMYDIYQAIKAYEQCMAGR